MSSDDYELFLWSCFPKDFHAAREGLRYDSLLRLQGAERQAAIDLLMLELNGLANGNKFADRVIEAVGWLRLQEAREILHQLLTVYKKPIEQAQIGLALHRIAGYPQGVELAIRALDKTPINNQFSRLQSAEYLLVYAKEYKLAVTRLLQAVDDPDDFVASHSISLLKFVFEGRSPITNLLDTILETLVEYKKKRLTEILTRKIALKKVTRLIEIEFQRNPQWS